jgi:hypothetical protein
MKYFDKDDFYITLKRYLYNSNSNSANFDIRLENKATVSMYLSLLKGNLKLELHYYKNGDIHSKETAFLYSSLIELNITSTYKLYQFINNWVESIETKNELNLPKKSSLQYNSNELEYKSIVCGGHSVQCKHTRQIKTLKRSRNERL